ncbi:hypothetical protein MTR67_021831 [Solanum verrucosum]|uniref:Uncharacterized protein n=1 Tax=Solanum verrucosum TaxID=315347 RepID=A0AAF0TQ94_SOLVR|nr:hypothetical protein MTR67_021831 [Solanum verrucosum]
MLYLIIRTSIHQWQTGSLEYTNESIFKKMADKHYISSCLCLNISFVHREATPDVSCGKDAEITTSLIRKKTDHDKASSFRSMNSAATID